MPEQDWTWTRYTIKILMKTFWSIALTMFVITMLGGILIKNEVIQETTAAYYSGMFITLSLIIWRDTFLKIYEEKYGVVDWSQVKWL